MDESEAEKHDSNNKSNLGTDDDENINITVPTNVQCLIKADGKIIAPSADSWRIRNLSSLPVTISSVNVDSLLDNAKISAQSESTSLYDDTTGSTGTYSLNISSTNCSIKKTGEKPDNPLQIQPQQSLGFNWNVNINANDIQHMNASLSVATLSFDFTTIEKTAFAIYSEEDGSLDFYKRLNVPQIDETWNGKKITKLYTGFETQQYTCIKYGSTGDNDTPTAYGDKAIIDTPWYNERLLIKAVNIVDDGIAPKYIDYWFMNFKNCISLKLNKLDISNCAAMIRTFNRCRSATDIEVSKWDTANINSMMEAFLECNCLETLDISSWNTTSNTVLHSIWNNCHKLSKIIFGSQWDTSNVTGFACVFYGTSFEEIDVSSWNFDKAENIGLMFGQMPNLHKINISSLTTTKKTLQHNQYKENRNSMFWCDNALTEITVGNGLRWNDIRDDEDITPISPNGTWYSMTTGKEYSPIDLPSNTADTYVSDKNMLPDKAFAIYSDTDSSLNLYKRKLCDVPSTGTIYNNRNVTNIYFDFETQNPSVNNSKYHFGFFHDIADNVDTIEVIDDGIKPQSMNGWFSDFSNLCGVKNLTKIDMSICTGMYYCFFNDQKLASISLANWNCPSLTTVGGMFERCYGLETIDLSNWSAPNLQEIWFFLYGAKLEKLDLSSCNISNIRFIQAMVAFNQRLKEIIWPNKFSFKQIIDARELFEFCTSLQLDCSDYDFKASCIHDNFNDNAKGVTLPLIWNE